MRWPNRSHSLTLVSIALVALSLGAGIALVRHSEHDAGLELDVKIYQQAAWHLTQANYCREAEAKHLPYSTRDRGQLFREHVTIFRTFQYTLPDWRTEAGLHEDWASALQGRTGNLYLKEPESWQTFLRDFF